MSIQVIDFEKDQPKVSGKLLWSGFDYDGLKLDLYGLFDRDGYQVEDVALANTRISVRAIIKDDYWTYFDEQCNENLPSWEQQDKERRYENRTSYLVPFGSWL